MKAPARFFLKYGTRKKRGRKQLKLKNKKEGNGKMIKKTVAGVLALVFLIFAAAGCADLRPGPDITESIPAGESGQPGTLAETSGDSDARPGPDITESIPAGESGQPGPLAETSGDSDPRPEPDITESTPAGESGQPDTLPVTSAQETTSLHIVTQEATSQPPAQTSAPDDKPETKYISKITFNGTLTASSHETVGHYLARLELAPGQRLRLDGPVFIVRNLYLLTGDFVNEKNALPSEQPLVFSNTTVTALRMTFIFEDGCEPRDGDGMPVVAIFDAQGDQGHEIFYRGERPGEWFCTTLLNILPEGSQVPELETRSFTIENTRTGVAPLFLRLVSASLGMEKTDGTGKNASVTLIDGSKPADEYNEFGTAGSSGYGFIAICGEYVEIFSFNMNSNGRFTLRYDLLRTWEESGSGGVTAPRLVSDISDKTLHVDWEWIFDKSHPLYNNSRSYVSVHYENREKLWELNRDRVAALLRENPGRYGFERKVIYFCSPDGSYCPDDGAPSPLSPDAPDRLASVSFGDLEAFYELLRPASEG